MWILQFIIPFHECAVLGVASHQLNRFSDNIDILRAVDRDPVLRLESENAFHGVARPQSL